MESEIQNLRSKVHLSETETRSDNSETTNSISGFLNAYMQVYVTNAAMEWQTEIHYAVPIMLVADEIYCRDMPERPLVGIYNQFVNNGMDLDVAVTTTVSLLKRYIGRACPTRLSEKESKDNFPNDSFPNDSFPFLRPLDIITIAILAKLRSASCLTRCI